MFKHFLRLLFIATCTCTCAAMMSCASGQGGTGNTTNNTSTGTAALSLQLEEGATGLSQNNYQLDFTTFALAFSKITLGDQEVTESFTADFFDEEITDVIEMEDVPTGEYNTATLTLGTASGLSGAAALVAHNLQAATVGSDVTSSLNGLSVLIIADAQNGADTCTLRVELVSDATITVGNDAAADIDVGANEETEVLVAVDPDAIFGTITVPATCSGDATVTISATENAALGTTLLSNLKTAFELESTDGHSHSHD